MAESGSSPDIYAREGVEEYNYSNLVEIGTQIGTEAIIDIYRNKERIENAE